MKRSLWKWILGISIGLLILIAVFMVVLWAMGNAVAALGCAIMSYTVSDAFIYNSQTFLEFYSDFIGSPMFYISLVPVISLVTSILMLILTRKNKKS